jgi:hypothetical protein
MKNMGADGLLDQLRKVTFFHALGAQKRAQGEIGFLRNFDVPADCFFLHFSSTGMQIDTYTPIIDRSDWRRVSLFNYNELGLILILVSATSLGPSMSICKMTLAL